MIKKFRRKLSIHQFKQNQEPQETPLQEDLQANVTTVRSHFGFTSDLAVRTIWLGTNQSHQASLLFLKGMSNQDVMDRDVIRPLMNTIGDLNEDMIDHMMNAVLHVSLAWKENTLEKVLEQLARGYIVLFIHNQAQCIIIGAKSLGQRSVEEPAKEAVIRGPREGFIETIDTNLSLIRKRYHNPNLQIETYWIGTQSNTRVCLAYVRGIVKEELVDEVRKRLSVIKMDAILDSGYIEQWIEDEPYSIFPTIFNSEKPDILVAKILEGRVAILVDGSPVALMVPATFQEFFQNPEDYYSRPFYASFLRLLRYAAFFVSAFLPSLYISFENFHKDLVPPTLLFSFINAREGVPFPLPIELLLMAIVYEWLREAGVRMPRPIGQAVSIVGALVIGEAAVSAGLVGAPTVIIIAASAITSFIFPAVSDVVVILRFVSIFAASALGLYGNFLVFYLVAIYLCDLRSFGIPYLAPLAPLKLQDWKDFFIRFPLWFIKLSSGATPFPLKKQKGE
ncbi:spore germination protein [Brevibacillus sp. NPDC058079]|uniref:spore germination protein n=1 Tax=Brevibacillus sp. NPDC058079 TaxID=3346330 RepID=UPI0036EF64EA